MANYTILILSNWLLRNMLYIYIYNKIIIWRAPRPSAGRALTNDLCSQNLKINVKVKTSAVLILIFIVNRLENGRETRFVGRQPAARYALFID